MLGTRKPKNTQNYMKKVFVIVFVTLILGTLTSCGVSNKTVLRHQKMEEGVANPTTIEESFLCFIASVGLSSIVIISVVW